MAEIPTTAGWQRVTGETVLELGSIVAVIRHGKGIVTRAEHMNRGDLFCYLPPLPARTEGTVE